jgi:hypothetical protein
MKMTGWNLPPGCNVSDLPGNDPAEEENEAIYDSLYQEMADRLFIDTKNFDARYETHVDQLINFVLDKMKHAHNEGRKEVLAEQKEWEEIKQAEALAKEWKETE